MDKYLKFLASFAYIGYLPASGTIASIFPAAVYYFFRGNSSVFYLLSLLFIVLAFGFCGRAQKAFGKKDPRSIVLDEIAGMFVAFLFLPFKADFLIIGFIAFRFFDIVKPWPLKGIEKLDGSLGVVLDDLVAGLYANIILQLVRIFIA